MPPRATDSNVPAICCLCAQNLDCVSLVISYKEITLVCTCAQGLEDVYRGGAHDERLARSIEMALTTKDEFGQVMTPKERFRQLCYE